MGTVYSLALRQLAGRWRLAVMTVLAALPVVIAAVLLDLDAAPSVVEFESVVLGALLAGAIVPLVVLAIAAPAFANELEDRTLANLVLTPLPRWQLVVPKWAASVTLAAPFVLASAAATAWIAFLGDWRAVAAVAGAMVAAVAMYASAFLWLGLVSPQAIGAGLVYVVLWEGFLAEFLAGVRTFSIRYHALSAMHHLDPRRIDGPSHPEAWTIALVLAGVVAGFLALATRRLRRMDVP